MSFMQKMPCFSRIMPYLKGKYNFGIQFQIKVSSWDIKQVILLQRIYKSKYLKEKPLNCAHFNLVLPLYPIPDNSDYMQLVETILSRIFIALQHVSEFQNAKDKILGPRPVVSDYHILIYKRNMYHINHRLLYSYLVLTVEINQFSVGRLDLELNARIFDSFEGDLLPLTQYLGKSLKAVFSNIP